MDGAIREYRAYLKQVPDNVMARSNLGAALSRSGRYEEAIAEYRQALKKEPGNLPIRVNLALSYYKTAQVSTAAEQLAIVVAKQPSNRQAVLLLADCDLQLGEYKKVIELLGPLEKQSPDDKALIYLLGTAFIRDKQPARGQVLVDRILREGDSAEARLLLGTTKMNAREFAEALVDLKKAVELNPKLPDVYSYYGLALLTTGDMAGAADAFRKELESNPNDFVSNLQLGVVLKQDQRYDEARSSFERALRVRPGDPGVRYQLATLDLMAGKLDQACAKLEALDQRDSGFRGSARFAGHRVLPAQTESRWRPGARTGSEIERREARPLSRGPRTDEPPPAALGAAAARRRSRLLAGDQVCAECHRDVTARFRSTPMARALVPVAACEILQRNPELTFQESGYESRIVRDGDRTVLTVKSGGETLTATLLWAFGRGQAGQTYVYERNGTYYESRVSFYNALHGLDLTMGAQTSGEEHRRRRRPPDGRPRRDGLFRLPLDGRAFREARLHLESMSPGVGLRVLPRAGGEARGGGPRRRCCGGEDAAACRGRPPKRCRSCAGAATARGRRSR